MNPETMETIRAIQLVVAVSAAVIGLVASAVGTVIGTKIGQKWLEKDQENTRKWVHDHDVQLTDHERRISTVEGICEATRASKAKC